SPWLTKSAAKSAVAAEAQWTAIPLRLRPSRIDPRQELGANRPRPAAFRASWGLALLFGSGIHARRVAIVRGKGSRGRPRSRQVPSGRSRAGARGLLRRPGGSCAGGAEPVAIAHPDADPHTDSGPGQ